MKKLITLLLFFVAMPSWAERQFDIEVIIFKRAVNPEMTAESWPNNPPEISLERAGKFSDASFRASKQVTLLPYSQYELGEQVQKLKRHAGFDVLMHTAWRQGDQGRFGAPVFHIQAGKDYSNQFNVDGSPAGSNATSSVIDGVTEESIPAPLFELDGTFQVYVEHYLYADVELDLKAPSVREVVLDAPIQTNVATQDATQDSMQDNAVVQAGLMEDITPTVETQAFLKSYRFDQKRRMRSTETHYLDHPLMGVIIQVRRVAQ